jgi:hypothetical protein
MPINPRLRPQNHVTRAMQENHAVSSVGGWPFVPPELVAFLEGANPVDELVDMAPGADRERYTGRLQLIRQMRQVVASYANFSAEEVAAGAAEPEELPEEPEGAKDLSIEVNTKERP